MAVKAKESRERENMPRSRWVKPQLFTVAGLLVLVLATVFAVTPANHWILRSQTAAAVDPPVASEYACDLSDYGYTGPPVDITATASVKALATAVSVPGLSGLFSATGPMSFSTSLVTLPASVAARLTKLSEISLQASIPVSGAPAAAPVAKIWGTVPDSFLPVGPLTQLQVWNAVVTVFYSSPGTAVLDGPAPSLEFTPYRDGNPLPAINCAVTSAAAAPTTVTVTAALATGAGIATASGAATAAPPAASTATATPAATETVNATAIPTSTAAPSPAAAPTGTAVPAGTPVYGCATTYRVTNYRTPVPMTVTTSGVPRVGHALTVTLTSPSTGLADPEYGLTTQLAFDGTLPVTGAQAGAVKLKATTAYTDLPSFSVSGSLRLTKAGTDTISLPRHFVYTVDLQSGPRAVFSCSLAASPAPVPAGLTVRVAP
jgi:hypothetical protein